MLIFFISGAHVTGQMDDIVNLKELCSKHNIWLHLSGDNLSGLALTTFKTKVFYIIIAIIILRVFTNLLFFHF